MSLENMKQFVAKQKALLAAGEGDYATLLNNLAENTWRESPELLDFCREAAELYALEHEVSEEELDVLAAEFADRLAQDLAGYLQLFPEDLGLE